MLPLCLCDEAKPGQILISRRVLTKVEDAVKVEPVGEFELKGDQAAAGGIQCGGRVTGKLRLSIARAVEGTSMCENVVNGI